MPQNTVPRGYTYPLYGDPMNFPAQIQDLAQDIDADMDFVAGRIADARERPSARMTLGAVNTAVPNGAGQTTLPFTFGSVAYDNASMASLPGGSLTLPEQGVYFLSAYVNWVGVGSGTAYNAQVSIASTGGLVTVPVTVTRRTHAVGDTGVSIACLHYYSGAGADVLTLQVRHSAAAARNVSFRNLCATKISNLPGGS